LITFGRKREGKILVERERFKKITGREADKEEEREGGYRKEKLQASEGN